MARTFEIGNIGEIDDRVRLKLNGQDVLIAESYEVRTSLFQQPAEFSLHLGHSGVAKEILRRYPPNTPFELLIGTVPQFTGVIDDPGADSTVGGTSVTFRGRDASAPLHDDHIDAEKTYKDATYMSLAKKQLEAVGLGARTIAGSNLANRRVKGGVPIQELSPLPRDHEQLLTGASSGGAIGVVHQQIQSRINERRHEFLSRYLQLVGLFFWASADGNFVLSEPNCKQAPTSSILRRVGMSREETNVTSASLQNNTRDRFSVYNVYGRSHGGKNGHPKALGLWVDDEMTNWGFTKSKTWRSQNAKTREQAEFIARRMAAEDRRRGWQLRYTVAGHTTPFTSGTQRAVWIPDTIHKIYDDIIGINDLLFLTDCTYKGSGSGITTDLVFQRPIDQVWAQGLF
jgi:prophage tail gpP-like protein